MTRIFAIGLTALTLLGCGPFVEVVKVDEKSAGTIRLQVQAYRSEQLNPSDYRVLEPVSATSCKNQLWDPPASQENALGQLRVKAQGLGGNGILNPVCGGLQPTSLTTNCWQSVTCAATAILVLGPAASQQPPSAENPSISSGTGFVVDPNGFLLTAFHVIQDAKTISVTCPGQVALPATLRTIARNNDLALLQIAASGLPYLSFGRTGSLRLGDPVFTIGYPASDILGPEPKFTDGSISSLSGLGGEASLLQITVPVQPGNSGGPLVNEQGYAIGVVTSSAAVRPFLQATGALPQNINWAVKADYAVPLFEVPSSQAPAKDRAEAIGRTKQATCTIEVLH